MSYSRLFSTPIPTPVPVNITPETEIEENQAPTPIFPVPENPVGVTAFGKYETITRLDQLDAYISAAFEAGVVAVDTETTSLQPKNAGLVGISLCITEGNACYIPIGHEGTSGQLLELDVIARLKPLLEDCSIIKIMQNGKFDWRVFNRRGITVSSIEDTMLMSYVLDAGPHARHGMDVLSEKHLRHKTIRYTDVTKVGRKHVGFAQVPIGAATEYAAEDADVTMRLWQLLRCRMYASSVRHVYETLELPMIEVLASMEDRGIMVDRPVLAELSAEFAGRIKALGVEINKLAGKPINPNSPKQLGKILFTDAGLPAIKTTDKGNISTDVEVLRKLAGNGQALPAKVIEWRGLSKLKSTYTDALQEAAIAGRVHTSFNLAGTVTGRLSSSDPNLQNIPIKTKDGQRVRRAFIAPEGHKIVVFDYSQIELRVLDQVADIPEMHQAFMDDKDIHQATASGMFKVPLDEVPKELRSRAKAINFGIIYGMQAAGLAKQLGVTKREAELLLLKYHQQYQGIRPYIKSIIEFARSRGFVETISLRRCHYPDILAPEDWKRSYAEREAVNMTIQGSAADIIRVAMPLIEPALEMVGLSARMLLQVHDELVFEVRDEEVQETIGVVKPIMIEAADRIVKFDVPLKVATEAAQNWADAH